jgi:hypothetical protein
VAGLALALGARAFGATPTRTWSAKLTAAAEVPKQAVKDTAATGTFTGTLKGSTLTFTLTFSKLTGPATQAHIHIGRKGVAGNVAVALCTPCKSPATGIVTITPAMLGDFAKHALYVNVHTAANPSGEIRGQIG